MFAVKGIYDGVSAIPKGKVPFNENYEVIITFVKPKVKRTSVIRKTIYNFQTPNKKEAKEMFLDDLENSVNEVNLHIKGEKKLKSAWELANEFTTNPKKKH